MLSRRAFLHTVAAASAATARKPNLLLILADDLGFSDLGCFGGEIETPNLDRLASNGLRLTQLYNNARCCPSRAALMTGRHPHAVGMGNMTGGQPRPGFPGYSGRVDPAAEFLPATLRRAGYTPLMCGKWHLGQPGPIARGFEEFYGMIHGFDSFWDPAKYTRLPAGRPVETTEPFHATDAFTNHALRFIRDTKTPWFLYLAYNAPHFPLHAPKALIDHYQPVYEQGWDKIRAQRHQRQLAAGLLPKTTKLTPRSLVGPNRVSTPNGWAEKQNPPWDTLPADRKRDLARRMATFAAMVHQMDQNIGRIVQHLEATNQLANTLILFTSDNGACAEWDPFGFDVSSGPTNTLHTGEALNKMGQPGTYHSYGSAWANTGNTPWRLYKHYTHEGGISCPTIAHWPAGIPVKNAINHQPWHFIDVLPTLAHIAGATPSAPAQGENMAALFQNKKPKRGPLFWEHEGSRAVRQGKWKLTAVHPTGPWELYDIEADRTELNNLAAQHPARVKSMAAQWNQWAKSNNVLPWIWNPPYSE